MLRPARMASLPLCEEEKTFPFPPFSSHRGPLGAVIPSEAKTWKTLFPSWRKASQMLNSFAAYDSGDPLFPATQRSKNLLLSFLFLRHASLHCPRASFRTPGQRMIISPLFFFFQSEPFASLPHGAFLKRNDRAPFSRRSRGRKEGVPSSPFFPSLRTRIFFRRE